MRLRPTRLEELDFVLAAEAHPENAPFIRAWSRDRHAAALGHPDLRHLIVESGEGRPAGFVIVAGIQNPDRSVEFMRVVVTDKGRGMGRAVVREVKRLAFEDWGAHRLWLDVKTDNARARALYRSEGFEEEGILRECLRTGAGYESLVVMSLLARP